MSKTSSNFNIIFRYLCNKMEKILIMNHIHTDGNQKSTRNMHVAHKLLCLPFTDFFMLIFPPVKRGKRQILMKFCAIENFQFFHSQHETTMGDNRPLISNFYTSSTIGVCLDDWKFSIFPTFLENWKNKSKDTRRVCVHVCERRRNKFAWNCNLSNVSQKTHSPPMKILENFEIEFLDLFSSFIL